MASRTVIPRFLLPLQSPLWRGARIQPAQNLLVRFSTSTGRSTGGSNVHGKPIVLEKPAKFNPPSHGSRLKRNTMPKHYGPSLSGEEIAAQRYKSYPGMMAPEGTWSHFFWHSRVLHTCITMGVLLSMALATFFMNYALNSPFKDLIPPTSDLWRQPFEFFSSWKNVIILHEKDKSVKAHESRIAHQNDVAKRRYYMKMHGIETKDPITSVFGKSEDPASVEEVEAEAMGRAPPPKIEEEQPKGRKKMFGIF